MSERYVHKTNTVYESLFRVIDGAGNGVTGLSNGAFTKRLYKNHVTSAVTVTITEIGNGDYYLSYTPDADGYWVVIFTNASYVPGGWQDDIQCVSFGFDDLLHRKKGSSVNDGSATATSFVTALTETTDDFWKGSLLVLTSGTLAGQSAMVKSYNGTTKAVTLEGEGLTGGPANSVTFDLIPMVSQHQIARRVALKQESDWEAEMSSNFRCLGGAIARDVNRNVIVSDTLHVKKSDDSTDLFTAALTRDSSQVPVSDVDPA